MLKRLPVALAAAFIALLPLAASAHVVVKPAEVGIGSEETFTTHVPNEKTQPVTGLRLVIPAGLSSVSPNVKPGWTISEQKSGSGDAAAITEISWSGGQIPVGQQDDFLFSAQAPGKATQLQWKAYQTYADGTVVSWDQTPTGADDESTTPYSVTKVINDLTAASTATNPADDWQIKTALVLSVLALLAAVAALTRKR